LASAVRGLRLTAWAMARPTSSLLHPSCGGRTCDIILSIIQPLLCVQTVRVIVRFPCPKPTHTLLHYFKTQFVRIRSFKFVAGAGAFSTKHCGCVLATPNLSVCLSACNNSEPLNEFSLNLIFQDRSCGIYGGQFETGTSFSPNAYVFPCQCHSTRASYSFMHRICHWQ
jgi:hypothetical protein